MAFTILANWPFVGMFWAEGLKERSNVKFCAMHWRVGEYPPMGEYPLVGVNVRILTTVG